MAREYPEHEKLNMVEAEHDAVVAFVEWLTHQDYVISHFNSGEGLFTDREKAELIARYFGIDYDACQKESAAWLQEARDLRAQGR